MQRGLKQALDNADLTLGATRMQASGTIPSSILPVPWSVELQYEKTWYVRWEYGGRAFRGGSHNDKCLEEFLTLAEDYTDEEQIKWFVENFGVLGIHVNTIPTPEEVCVQAKQYQAFGDKWYAHVLDENASHSYSTPAKFEYEAISVYKTYARQAKAMLKIAASLCRSRPAEPDDWRIALAPRNPAACKLPRQLGDRHRMVPEQEKLEAQRHVLAILVTDWLRLSKSHPLLIWAPDAETPELQMNTGVEPYKDDLSSIARLWELERAIGRYCTSEEDEGLVNRERLGLFATLTAKLIAMLTSAHGVSLCEQCGKPFNPTRVNNLYCRDECKSQVHRQVARASNKRAREKQKCLSTNKLNV